MEFEPKQPVTPEPEGVVGLRNSRFPERVGRTRFDTALEIAQITNKTGQSITDWSLFNSVTEMDAVTDR